MTDLYEDFLTSSGAGAAPSPPCCLCCEEEALEDAPVSLLSVVTEPPLLPPGASAAAASSGHGDAMVSRMAAAAAAVLQPVFVRSEGGGGGGGVHPGCPWEDMMRCGLRVAEQPDLATSPWQCGDGSPVLPPPRLAAHRCSHTARGGGVKAAGWRGTLVAEAWSDPGSREPRTTASSPRVRTIVSCVAMAAVVASQ